MNSSVLSIVEGEEREYEPELIHRKIEKNIVQGCGSKTAIIYNDPSIGEKIMSFNTMNQMANQIANFLISEATSRKLTANQDDDWLIGVCMHPTKNLIITILSILKTGAAYLPIDPTYPVNRIQHILEEAKPIFVIYDHLNADLSPNLFDNTNAISFEECTKKSISLGIDNLHDNETLTRSIDPLALVEYTSGSTGLPKGVRIPHSIIMNRLKWQFETFPYAPNETIGIFKTVLTFLDSVPEIWGPLFNERSVLVVPREITKDPSRLVAVLDVYKIKRLILVPTLLKSILTYLSLKKGPKLLKELTFCSCASEILPQQLVCEFYDYFREDEHVLCNFYGTTEISGDVSYYVIEGRAHAQKLEKIPIGFPIFNTAIYVLDENKEPVKTGQLGELFVTGLNLANGYVNAREKDRFSKNLLSSNPKYSHLYRTGDYARIDKNGVVHYEGRTDSQIKVRGYRIDLNEIEMQLMSIEGVLHAVPLVYHNEKEDQALLSFVVVDISKRMALNDQVIKTILKTKLPEYMIPQVICIENIPLLTSGKTDRQALLKLYESSSIDLQEYYNYAGVLSDQMLKARILFETIGAVTNHSSSSSISLLSNFYEIGGNSLNSILTVAKLKEKQYNIDISSFISAVNLQEIMSHMTPLDEAKGDKTLACGQIGNKMQMKVFPLSDEHKNESIFMVASSFYEKSELDKYAVGDKTKLSDYLEMITAIWQPLLTTGFSYVIKDKNNRLIGASFNLDANNEPKIPLVGGLRANLSFVDSLESPVKKSLTKEKPILLTFMMGTHSDLTPAENIAVMTFMETEAVRLAKEKQCAGIITTNISTLTQQLAISVNGYRTMKELRANEFILDGFKPFAKAPDSYKVTVEWKEL